MDSGPLVPANNAVIREMQPAGGLDSGRMPIPRMYPELPAHESPLGEYLRILDRKSVV